MHYVYILKSSIINKRYIGCTGDLEQRLSKHNAGGVRSTKAYRPWIVIHTEAFETSSQARSREYELKHNSWKRKELFDRISK